MGTPIKFWNLMKTERGSYSLDLFGYVGGSKDDIWAQGFNEQEFLEDFRQIPLDAEIDISINSAGGSVFTALSIVSILAEHKAPVTIRVNGLAASAATIITSTPHAKVVMPRGSMMMIHRVSSYAEGSAEDMKQQAEAVQKIEDQLVGIYQRKTGRSEQEIRDAMAATTWYSADEAKAFGLCDEIDESVMVTNSYEGDAVVVNGLKLSKSFFGKAADRFFVAAARSVPAAVSKEGPAMDLEKLKAEHPDIYSAIRDEAIAEGRKLERDRLAAIEAVAMPGYDDLVKAAKEDDSMTSEKLAVQIVKAEMARVKKADEDVKADAAVLDKVDLGIGNEGPNRAEAAAAKQAALDACISAAKAIIAPKAK